MKFRKLATYILTACLLTSCWVGGSSVDNSDDPVSLIRYDRLQNEYVRFNSITALQRMNTQHSRITQTLIEDILTLGSVSDDNINEKLRAFYSDTTLIRLMEDVATKFEDTTPLEKELNKGFSKLLDEVPHLQVPHIYTQVSALNESIIITDSLLGISLDKYMGQDYPLYNRYYYEYQRRSMRPDRMAPDCLMFYLLANYPLPETSNRTLLEIMIHQGKINYVVKQMLGMSSSEDALGYSEEEKEWAKENKKKVWQYLLSSRHLYSTDPMMIRRYIRPTPYIAFFGENSPALIGTWIGMEIVSSYMKNNKRVTIEQLLGMTDYELLLNESRFTP